MFFIHVSMLSVVTRATGFTMRGYCLIDQSENILSQDDLFEQTFLLDLAEASAMKVSCLFDTTLSFAELLTRTASRRVVPALRRDTGDRLQLEIVPLPTEHETLFVILVEQLAQTPHPVTNDPVSEANLVVGERPSDLDPFFEVSPLPMWIFNTETLAFVAVNEAAIQRYGWSREEFLTKSILDIRPESERERVGRIVNGCFTRVGKSGPWLHQNRAGQIWNVEALTHAVTFRGMPCRLVKVLDLPTEASMLPPFEERSTLAQSISVAETREARIVEMKKEINQLLCALGREPKFRSVVN